MQPASMRGRSTGSSSMVMVTIWSAAYEWLQARFCDCSYMTWPIYWQCPILYCDSTKHGQTWGALQAWCIGAKRAHAIGHTLIALTRHLWTLKSCSGGSRLQWRVLVPKFNRLESSLNGGQSGVKLSRGKWFSCGDIHIAARLNGSSEFSFRAIARVGGRWWLWCWTG